MSMKWYAYEVGFKVGVMEIMTGTASFVQAEERGLYPRDSESREWWDRGYDDCVCAHRLGHDVRDMAESRLFGPSVMSMPAVVGQLLDGKWDLGTRMDPRH